MGVRRGTDRSHLEQSQERMASMVRAPPPMVRSVRWVPAYDVVSGDTYLRQETFGHQPRCDLSQWTAFILRCSNRWLLKALHKIA